MEWNCGNGIAEIGKKNLAIVAMPLPKIGGKKNSGCRNHKWGIKKKKKSATSTIFLQHFHNKSHVISYY